MHGKNFFKIREEFLPDRDTADLIEFYYFWKKTAGAAANRPRGRRHHHTAIMRRIKTGGAKGKDKTPKDDPNDLSSCSEGEMEEVKKEGEDDNEEGESMSPYYCRHCFSTNSRDWHHCCKEKLLLCRDCRTHFKRYAELPNLDGPSKRFKEEQEEIKRKKEEEEEAERQRLKKIEEMKAMEEAAAKAKAAAAVAESNKVAASPSVASAPTTSLLTSQLQQQPSFLPPPAHQQHGPPMQQPPPMAHASSSEIQVIGERPGLGGMLGQQPPPHQQVMPPREPSPPPKQDGSECHRSQSAIFTRMWNRGEGNSCSRTDMIFKPVPDSKLARKREERLRKAHDREAEARNAAEHAKRAATHPHDLPHGHPQAPGPPPGHPLFSPTTSAASADPFRPGSRFPPTHPMAAELERREQEQRMLMAATSPALRPPMFPPGHGFGPAPPPPGQSNAHAAYAAAAAHDARRMEEIRAAQQYAQLSQMDFDTDPLVRLRMAGITPENPGASPFSHPGFLASLRGPGPPQPPHALMDPRYRQEMLMRPGGYGLPPGAAMELQFLMREQQQQQQAQQAHSLMAAHQHMAAQHQHEQLLRLDAEEKARLAAANQGQRPP
jgi:arginine-glutamic acid dipeptide repeat-containing protein